MVTVLRNILLYCDTKAQYSDTPKLCMVTLPSLGKYWHKYHLPAKIAILTIAIASCYSSACIQSVLPLLKL